MEVYWLENEKAFGTHPTGTKSVTCLCIMGNVPVHTWHSACLPAQPGGYCWPMGYLANVSTSFLLTELKFCSDGSLQPCWTYCFGLRIIAVLCLFEGDCCRGHGVRLMGFSGRLGVEKKLFFLADSLLSVLGIMPGAEAAILWQWRIKLMDQASALNQGRWSPGSRGQLSDCLLDDCLLAHHSLFCT